MKPRGLTAPVLGGVALLVSLFGSSAAWGAEPLRVRFADDAGVVCRPTGCSGAKGAGASVLEESRRSGARIEGCYGLPDGVLRRLRARGAEVSQQTGPDLTQCFQVTPTSDSEGWESRLRAAPGVEWVESVVHPVPAQMPVPDFSAEEFIFESAPTGLGITDFYRSHGLYGQGVTFVDIEVSVDAGHLELRRFGGIFDGVGAGTSFLATPDSNDHGLASMGIVVAERDDRGTSGIAPNADPRFFTAYPQEYTWGAGAALLRALNSLAPGAVVLFELQVPGPNYDADVDPSGQFGMLPLEYSRADRDAILTATRAGIVVIEPAGNGFQDLDDPIYGGYFTELDSGALMIGAGNPPIGGLGPAREAMFYTNFGRRCDLQGYGALIYAPGYGDAWGGPESDDRYTARFGGTSAASPQVAGAALLLSSLARSRNDYLSPANMRTLLRDTGTPGQGGVGPLPDVLAAGVVIERYSERAPPPQERGAWSACRVNADCDAMQGHTCVSVTPSERYCLSACEPFAGDAECQPGFGCALQVWGEGVCTLRQGLGRTGDACHSELDCDVNYFCDTALGCQAVCSVSRDVGCGRGQSCLYTGEFFGDWGLCQQTSPNPDGQPDGGPCDEDSDCQGGTCFVDGAGGGVCTTLGCRDSGDCHGAGAVCLSDPEVGIPYCVPSIVECARDADCPDGQACGADGLCVPGPGCQGDAECPAGLVCEGGECRAGCQRSEQCEGGLWCRRDRCQPDPRCGDGSECRAVERCVEGACAFVSSGCRADADCGADRLCSDGECIERPSRRCPNHQIRQGDVCVNDGTCDSQDDCGMSYQCERGRCVRPPPLALLDALATPFDATVRDAGSDVAPTVDSGAAPDALGVNPLAPDEGGSSSLSSGRGCGCRAASQGASGGAAWWLAMLCLGARARRKRSR